MKRLAEGVEQLSGIPPNAVNVYLAGGILFDTGIPARGSGILKELSGRTVEAVA